MSDKKEDKKEEKIERLTVDVPIEKGIELQTRHIDIQISHAARLKVSRMYYGLLKSGAKLANGVRVTTAGHVVQWILDNLEEAE